MKKAFLIVIMVICLLGYGNSQAPTPVEGWPYVINPADFYVYSMPRFAAEGSQLHLYFNTLAGEVDKFNLDRTFDIGWPVSFDSLMFDPTPVVVDIDHDGRAEILTSAKMTGDNPYAMCYLFDDDGSVMPGFPFRTRWLLFFNAVDMDSDNEYEILAYDPRGEVIHCLDRFGNPKPGWPVNFHMPGVEYSVTGGPFIGDLDLDGNNEYLISGAWDIFAFRFDGSIQPGFPIHLQEDSTHNFWNNGAPPSMADLDGDGYLEIMTSGDNWSPLNPLNFRGFLAIYEHDGTEKPGWPHYFEQLSILHTPTPADINGDREIEIGFQLGQTLNYVDLNFDYLPGFPTSIYAPEGEIRGSHSDLITVDIDGDGDCEIFTDHNVFYADSLGHDSVWYYGHSYFFGIDHLGHDLPGYPIEVGGVYFRMPPTFTLDRTTNRLKMALATEFIMPDWMDSVFIELYEFSDSTGPLDQWPMFGHDNLHTRNYNFIDMVTSAIDDEEIILPKSPVLKQNYPNPFNNSTTIEFLLPKQQFVNLSLYDMLGRRIVVIYNQVMDAGLHKHRLSMNVPSGIYHYRLSTGNTEITKAMTIIK